MVSVIAISRTLGAGGEELGRLIAADLAFRYVDTEILDRAAAQAGVTRETMEQAEARRPLIARILDNMARANPAALYGAADIPRVTPSSGSYEALIVEVVRATAAEGRVVIVAHGASIPLAGLPGLLRVMVTAPREVRAKRLSATEGLAEAKALATLADSDRARAEYFQRFYGVAEELPTHYDLVLNTEMVGPTRARKAILALAAE